MLACRDPALAFCLKVVSLCFMGIVGFFNSVYAGRPVARLPFEPLSIVTNLSHRGLDGEDFTQCSFVFLYAMSMMFFRQNIQKATGFGLSRGIQKLSNQAFSPAQ
eukprot:m.212454 g.212454  ORF g.212454 m.212454 type:complete len:105 (+) comp18588_c0_seq1:374-688(+)